MKKYILIIFMFLISVGVSAEKFYPAILSFNAGELSPMVDVRSDLDKYGSGARTMENFIPLVEGGVTRTPGTYFVFETKTSADYSRLFPFHFSTIQSYVIEAGDQYFRFYKDDGLITSVDSSTELLLHCDGTDASTTFTDSGTNTHTVTANGNAELDTADYYFATAAGLFDGTGDYLTVPDSDGVNDYWHMGAGDYTIDFWFNTDLSAGNVGIFEQYDDADNYVRLYLNSADDIAFEIRSAAATKFATTTTGDYFSAGIWYHLAIVRDGNDIGYAVNGNWVYSTTDADMDWPDLAAVLNIGALTGLVAYDGHIDEFRVSKAARWTIDTTFTPPTQEYPFADTGNLTGGGYAVYEITTPYLDEDLFEIKTVQSADVLYLFHPDYPPKTLTRTAHASWTLSDFQAKQNTQMVISGITQADPAVVTATTVPATLADDDLVYIASVTGMTEVNNIFFTADNVAAGTPGTFELSGIDSTGYAAWVSGGSAQETAYGTTDNNPSCGTFFEQRLVLAATNNNPQVVLASASGDYTDFTYGTDAADAFEYRISSNKVDRIRWMIGQDYLMAGTVGGVWRIGATTTSEPMTPSNVNAKNQITSGVKNIEAVQAQNAVLYASRSGLELRQLAYSFELDKYIAPDFTRIAGHITEGSTLATSGIKELDFQSEPLPILWAVRTDGELLGMTYEIQEQVYAWFRVVTDGSFESVAVISRENNEDQIWVIVNRTIDGSTVRYVEYFKPINFYSTLEDAFFVHSGLSWTGTDRATVTVLTQADPVVATVTASHGIETGDKLQFYNTGTWLDTNATTAHSIDGNDITLYLDDDSASVDGTGFPAYTYPATSTTYTYTGSAQNIVYIEQSIPVRIFLPAHGLLATQPIRIASVGGMTEINGDHIILGVTEDTITINEDATGWTAFTAGGTLTGGSGTTTDGTVDTVIQTLNGFDHLEGEALSIMTDGAIHPSETVSSGAVTLDYYANKVHGGMPFSSILEPMKIHANVQGGSTRGQKQKISKLTIAFYESYGGQAGRDSSSLKDIPFGTGGVPSLVTDDINFEFPGDWKDEATIYIYQDDPMPMTILGLIPRYNVTRD